MISYNLKVILIIIASVIAGAILIHLIKTLIEYGFPTHKKDKYPERDFNLKSLEDIENEKKGGE